MANPDEGVEKSAILLLSLGEDEAAEVLKNLGPKEVQKLGHAMAALKTVPREKVEAVIDEFQEVAGKGAPVAVDDELIKAMQGSTVDSPRGAFRFSKAHNPVQNIYLRRAEGLDNKVVEIVSKDLEDPARGCKM